MTDRIEQIIELFDNKAIMVPFGRVRELARQIDALYQPVAGRPRIVCLCGSTRFGKEFQEANLNETLAGNIVLSIGCNMRSDTEIFSSLSEDELTKIKIRLDELHLRKIDLADEVLILNVGGYIGESTGRELEYAREKGKQTRFLEPI